MSERNKIIIAHIGGSPPFDVSDINCRLEIFPENLVFADVLEKLIIKLSKAVIVLIGGAGGLAEEDLKHLRPLFDEVLVPFAEANNAIVIDGGTDAGVMRLMGWAKIKLKAGFPLIGVVPAGLVVWPGREAHRPEAVKLEPNHTHFVLVPGDKWGDESPWIDRIASELAKTMPAVTVLINGGEISYRDMELSLASGRPVVAIAGTGRLADELAAKPVKSPLCHIIDITEGMEKILNFISSFLKGAEYG